MSQTDGPHAAEMFSMQIRRLADDTPLQVISAEVVRPGFRHRLTFADGNGLYDVLQRDLAAFVEEMLAETLDSGPRVIARPEVTLSLPGLVLSRLRAIIGAPVGEARQATLRFRYFIGGVQNAFAAQTYFDRPALEHSEEIGLRTLEDVTVPILNIALTAQNWPDLGKLATQTDRVTTALSVIESHATELEFYAGLLRRYIEESGPKRIEALRNFQDPVAQLLQAAEPPVAPISGLPAANGQGRYGKRG